MNKKLSLKLILIVFVLMSLTIISKNAAEAGWTSMSTGWGGPLYSVWGSSASDVFATGVGGAIFHYDGSPDGTWSRMDNSSS